MFFHPTVLKWVLYISIAKILATKIWGLVVFLAYALMGGIIIGSEYSWEWVSRFF